MRLIWAELPGALMLSILTAVVTLLLVIVLSAVLGGESRELQRQGIANGQETVDHAKVARCEMAYVVEMLRTLGMQSQTIDFSEYPSLNTDGLDCEQVITQPFVPGQNLPAPSASDGL